MKIVQINCVYGVGSTGKLVRDIHHSLIKEGNDAHVIVPTANQFTNEQGVHTTCSIAHSYLNAILRRGTGFQYDWAWLPTRRMINILRDLQPEIVHLHCINGNCINIYMLLKYLAEHNIKTLYTLHAEFPYTGGCGHAYECMKWHTGCGHCSILHEATQSVLFDWTHRTWKKQKSCYERFNEYNFAYTAVSPWLLDRAKQSPMLCRFHGEVVMNGVNTNIFHNYESLIWHNRLRIDTHEKLILYVTASFNPYEENLKGGRFILQLAERLKNEPIRIVVAANYALVHELPTNVSYIGRTSSQNELAQLYSEADLTVITSKRETFSMPVVESLCCGTPVVGFKAGGPESIALSEYSKFVEYGDLENLLLILKQWLKIPFDGLCIAKQAQKIYSESKMSNDYYKQYQKLLSCI